VLADPALRPLDCEIDSIDGVVEVGLEVQLDAVRAALSRTPGASS
jgi:flagellar biosynthesis/type III secretory pathway protein FliH